MLSHPPNSQTKRQDRRGLGIYSSVVEHLLSLAYVRPWIMNPAPQKHKGQNPWTCFHKVWFKYRLFFFSRQDMLCSLGWPGTHGLELMELHLPHLPLSWALRLKVIATMPGQSFKFYLFLCVFAVCVHVYLNTHGSQGPTLDIFLNCSLPYCLRQILKERAVYWFG